MFKLFIVLKPTNRSIILLRIFFSLFIKEQNRTNLDITDFKGSCANPLPQEM